MTKFGTLNWSEKEGEGWIVLSTEFANQHRIVILDALVDWIALLQEEYERVLADGGNFLEPNK